MRSLVFSVSRIRKPFDLLDDCIGEEINDIGLVLLAVTIHSSIAQPENHERPWEIEVDQPMTEVMEVQPFGCHFGT
jgi:hypothetical protein